MKTIEQIVEDNCSMPTVSMSTFENEIKEYVNKLLID